MEQANKAKPIVEDEINQPVIYTAGKIRKDLFDLDLARHTSSYNSVILDESVCKE